MFMSDQMFNAIRANTINYWKIETLDDSAYDTIMFYKSFEKWRDGIPLDPEELDNWYRCFVVCTALVINKKWPEAEDKVVAEERDDNGNLIEYTGFLRSEGPGRFQQDMLHEVVADLAEFYAEDPQGRLIDYFNSIPDTDAEKRHLHRHISWKARRLIASFMEKRDKNYFDLKNKSLDYDEKNKDGDSKGTLGDKVADDKYDKDEIQDRDDLESFVLSLGFQKSQITKETQDILNEYFLQTQADLKKTANQFKNLSIVGLNPQDIWKFKLYQWNTRLIWDILQKIDIGDLLKGGEKKDLYLFYLLVCVMQLYRQDNTAVLHSDSQEVVIRKPFINILGVLIVKTFLYYATGLQQKVFSKVPVHPPEEYEDVKKFLTAIRYKPRDLLKTIKLPSIGTVAKPAPKPKTAPKPVKKVTALMGISQLEDSEVPESINLHELFESYEVFEELTQKIDYAFQHGTLDHFFEESVDTTDLTAFLSENKIELDTIFNFLNPESQKDKQDYSYITQGAISAITTAIMSSFKKDGENLHITLTNGESSLNIDKLAEASASFLKEMIEKDFAVKRGEVSSLAKSVVAKVVNEIDVPFSIPIPSDSEYESFKSMIEMNGPIKVKVPFANQGDRPFWDEEKVLDDKMIQLLEASIKEAINKADIGKAILKCL